MHETVFKILEPEERERFAVAIRFAGEYSRNQFYESVGMRTTKEYRAISELSQPLHRLLYLLLAGEQHEGALYFVEFMKQNLGQDFMLARQMTKLIELADLDALQQTLLAQIVCVSLYFATYMALWKGYGKIWAGLKARLQLLAAESESEWFKPFLAEAVRALEMFGLRRNEANLGDPGQQFMNTRRLGTKFEVG
jgi:hypothetical protein